MKHPLCFYVVACLMAALLFISSCAREYDLSDGNLDMNIQIGGDSLTLPLGSTGQIMISDFLYVEEFENLKVSEKGEYYMEFPFSVEETIDLSNYLEEVAIDGLHTVILKDTYIPDDYLSLPSRMTEDYIMVELESADTLLLKYDLSKAHSDGLVDIDSIIFEDAHIQLSVDLTTTSAHGVPEDVHVVIEMSVPEKYCLSEESGAFSQGRIFLQGDLDKDGHITFSEIDIEKLAFDIAPDGEFVFEDIFVLEHLSVLFPPEEIVYYLGEHIYLDIHFDVASENSDKIMASGFYGLVDKSLDPIAESLEMSGLPGILTGPEVNIDLVNSYALLDISTNSGIPFILDVTVDPGVESNVLEMTLESPSCDESQEFTTVSYCISNEMPQGFESYQWYQAEIEKLFHPIPQVVDLEVRAHTDVDGESHYLDFHKEYFVNTDFKMIVPLSFGNDLYLPLCDTITGLPQWIGTVMEMVQIDLIGTLETTVPVNIEFSADFIDGNGRVLDIPVRGLLVKGTNHQGVPVVRDFSLSIPRNDEVYDIAGVIVRFALLGGDTEGIAITEDCYVDLDLSVMLPGGVKFDLSDYIN